MKSERLEKDPFRGCVKARWGVWYNRYTKEECDEDSVGAERRGNSSGDITAGS
jgi:hypothetical protein